MDKIEAYSKISLYDKVLPKQFIVDSMIDLVKSDEVPDHISEYLRPIDESLYSELQYIKNTIRMNPTSLMDCSDDKLFIMMSSLMTRLIINSSHGHTTLATIVDNKVGIPFMQSVLHRVAIGEEVPSNEINKIRTSLYTIFTTIKV